MEKRMERHHMRGVFMDRVISSIGDTEARTASLGEFSSASRSGISVEEEAPSSSGPSSEMSSSSTTVDRRASGMPNRPSTPETSAAPSKLPDLRDERREAKDRLETSPRLVERARRSPRLLESEPEPEPEGDWLRFGVMAVEP